MNERIKELANKAGLYIAYDNREVTDKELEFFAELIVRECCEVAHSNFHVDGLTLGGILKEHFRIKEPTVNEQLRNRSTYFGNDL